MTPTDLDHAAHASHVVSAHGVTPRLVTALQSATGHPCVSLLLTTTPAPRMLGEDAARLQGLLREAERRLVEAEALPGVRSTVLNPLRELVEGACRGPAGKRSARRACAPDRGAARRPAQERFCSRSACRVAPRAGFRDAATPICAASAIRAGGPIRRL